MEDFEHSVRGPQVSATLSRKTSNGNGFTAKAVYDDVFGGPPKFGVRTFSSRVEDYSEIFGSFHSSRGSSIPILDLPVVDDGEVYSSKLDYCEIFGGFNGVDFAVSYEELFADPNKGGECSSEEAWTPGETGSVSEGSDSLACSERDQSLSNGASCNQFDGVNQFNLSFHKATQSSTEDGINGATHIAQLHAIPGYTFMVDEITHPQVTESNNPLPHVSDDSNQDMNFTEGGTEGKNFRKTNSFSPTSNAGVQTWESDVKSQKGYGRSVSISNEAFLTISEINLTTQPCLVPPPSRPPPKFAIKRGDSNISMGSRIKASHGRAVSDCSASYLDVEVDASSSAAASAAAMKEAMDKAQARIRSARESMEKKRDGIQNRRKLDLTDDLKRKDRDEGRAADGTNKLREERVQETCESANKGKRASAGEEMGKATRPDQVAREFEDREIFRTVPKESLQEEHGKESRSSQEFHRQEGSECKASNRFCELENADKSRAAFRVLEQEKTEKKIVQSTKPLNCKESKKKEAEEAFELEQANYMKLTGDEEAIRLPQESCMKLEAAKEALQREKKEIKTEAGDSSQKGEELKKKLKGAQGIPEPDGFDKLGVAMELKETEMKLEETHAQEKCEKKLKGAYEQKEKGKKLKEAREQEENVQKQKKAERQQNETRLKMFYESEEDERRLKQACEWEENEKRLKEAHLHGENESRLKEALEWEEKEKRVKDSYLREENEKKLKKACKQQESEKKLKEACEQEENEKRLKEACWWEENEKQKEACVREESEKKLKEAHDGEEYGEKLKESFEKEEHERRLKELHKQEDNENRPKKACEPEENEKRLKEVYVQEENEKRLKDASECEENETRQKEAYEREENEKRLEEANEREEVEGKLKVAYKACDHKEEKNLKISNEVFMNLKATKESSGDEEYDQELEDIREALEHIESGKIMRKDVVSSELPENGKESIPAKVSIELEGKERLETVKTSGLDQASHDNKQNENTLKVATEACPSDESEMKLGEHDMDVRRQVENIEKVSQVPFEREKIEKRKTHELPGDVNNVKEAHAAFDQEENKNNLKTTQVSSTRSSENGTKMESYLGANMSDKNKTTKRAEDININQNVERKERSCNGTITIEEREKKEKMQRERELEKERLRKIEEERDREREREKDRMAVERATREARERAFADARERAERAAVERATAEARQRAMAEAREKLEKASAEAREKSLSEKAYMEARLRAERAAVERATAEARERAVEKAMAERAASEARERSERFTGSKDGGMKQSSSSSDMQDPQFQSSGSFSGSRYPNYSNNGGAEGESAQRCKARLERHQRTVQRAAKALAEKNLRDLLAQREQAERNRLAETLDADVKRWSNGKEGNLRALLSTLQYILGPDSGWQPIPLTDVITAVAVKKAYRKATLCVHPDKLQQRGASIQQKYICEKVFDLLKEAWNKFNSEER